MKPEGYMPRVVDHEVEECLKTFGAIEIAGTKWCGKTWCALKHGASVSYVDLQEEAIGEDPSLVLSGDRPHVIDEWQLVPRIWDYVRHEVDGTRGLHGGWILTGSSTPRIRGKRALANAPHHSGAGRIGRIRMRPMSLFESGESTGQVSLRALFEGRLDACQVPHDVPGIVNAAIRGGWPEAIDLTPAAAQRITAEYLDLLFTESVPDNGKSGETARRLVSSLARNLSQPVTYKTLITDMYGAEDDPERIITPPTVAEYLEVLERMFLVEGLRGWEPASRSKKRLVTKPKRYLADPSLVVSMLGMSYDSLLGDWQTFGLLFESLCHRDLNVYAQVLPDAGREPLRYYRDDTGLEVDFIIELVDGRWAALEAKTGDKKVPGAIASLKRMRDKIVGDNPKACIRSPAFMGVLTVTSLYACEVEEDIYVIPIRSLAP